MLDSFLDVQMQIRRGVIEGTTLGGRLQVRDEAGGRAFTCELLRLTGGPPPALPPGATVVFLASDDDEQCGYVLGVAERPGVEPSHEPRDARDANVERDGEVRVIRLHAHQRLELTCGRASLIMNADGTVVLKGTTVVSRASGVNKIRGAAVRIN